VANRSEENCDNDDKDDDRCRPECDGTFEPAAAAAAAAATATSRFSHLITVSVGVGVAVVDRDEVLKLVVASRLVVG